MNPEGAPAAGIEYLTDPRDVLMGQPWFEIASPDHFWIQRRFTVLRTLLADEIRTAKRLLDIGCGNCLLAEMLRPHTACLVDGADLNVPAMENAHAGVHRLFCYDINEKCKEMEDYYDVVALLDVIEHIEDDRAFIQSAAFHLKPGGLLIINVPALESWRSNYDDAVGHLRRYDLPRLKEVVEQSGLNVKKWTYWASPLLPLLMIRKLFPARGGQQEIINRGFKPPGRMANRVLGWLCGLEMLPNHTTGASLFLVGEK